ncbi:calcium-binding protein CML38-like [Rhododendron vialii]|uniref:calcium-binding protein CML38-like n=1 Tax=Rhododendron vialii TaxID=182163 RepID=UPI00265FAE66|nr:calcium-binding protein CML38-like [Rhododendron vialii]
MDENKKKQYERVFSHFDENKDGKISPAELRLCLGTIGGEISESEAEAVVLLMDSDGDGLLGLEDFIRLVEGTEEEEKVKDLKEAFKMYEEMDDECKGSTGSSSITPRSLKRMLSRLGEKKSVGECEVMISQFDLNGDGVLNFDEFRNMMA